MSSNVKQTAELHHMWLQELLHRCTTQDCKVIIGTITVIFGTITVLQRLPKLPAYLLHCGRNLNAEWHCVVSSTCRHHCNRRYRSGGGATFGIVCQRFVQDPCCHYCICRAIAEDAAFVVWRSWVRLQSKHLQFWYWEVHKKICLTQVYMHL